MKLSNPLDLSPHCILYSRSKQRKEFIQSYGDYTGTIGNLVLNVIDLVDGSVHQVRFLDVIEITPVVRQKIVKGVRYYGNGILKVGSKVPWLTVKFEIYDNKGKTIIESLDNALSQATGSNDKSYDAIPEIYLTDCYNNTGWLMLYMSIFSETDMRRHTIDRVDLIETFIVDGYIDEQIYNGRSRVPMFFESAFGKGRQHKKHIIYLGHSLWVWNTTKGTVSFRILHNSHWAGNSDYFQKVIGALEIIKFFMPKDKLNSDVSLEYYKNLLEDVHRTGRFEDKDGFNSAVEVWKVFVYILTLQLTTTQDMEFKHYLEKQLVIVTL